MYKNFLAKCLFIIYLISSISLTGCSTTTQPTSTVKDARIAHPSGLERPGSFGIIPVASTGFSVYGSARVTANSKNVRAEIDCLDVEKIKTGYPATVLNMKNEINASGKVTRLPENTNDSDTCNIDLELDEPGRDNSPATETPAVDTQPGGAVMTSSISMGQSLPSIDSDVEVRIKLPVGDDLPYVDNQSLYSGKDGKTYVWFSEKDVTKVTVEDLQLVEVVPGATDGRVTKVIKGMPSHGSVLIGF
jgi:hypothetical protein